ncbi:MAG: FAD-binding oxidoreductase [Nanoarchaeota archaeon]
MECNATITHIFSETPDTKTFRLRPEYPFAFQPGQFIMVTASLGEEKVTRAFSISSAPGQEHMDITIKAEPTGHFSKFANEYFRVGDVMKVKGPYGYFTFTEQEQGDLLFIAAGSGISPFRSILQYIFEKHLPHAVTLLFSNKTEADIIFRKELETYAQHFPQFRFFPIVTREDSWDGHKSRVDTAFLQQHIHNDTLCYLCGPPLMVEDVKQQLLQLGVQEGRIKTEKYG